MQNALLMFYLVYWSDELDHALHRHILPSVIICWHDTVLSLIIEYLSDSSKAPGVLNEGMKVTWNSVDLMGHRDFCTVYVGITWTKGDVILLPSCVLIILPFYLMFQRIFVI